MDSSIVCSDGNVELLKQENFNLKLKINALENLAEHLKEDNDLLTREKDDAIKSIEAQFQIKMRQKNDELSNLREDLEKCKEEIKELKSLKNAELVQPKSPVQEDNKELLLLHDELMVQIEELKSKLALHVEDEIVKKMRILELEEEHLLLKKNLEEHKNLLQMKTEQIQELNTSLQEVKDEKLLLSSELAALKAVPSDVNNRGNSIFKEVEDRRKAMATKLTVLYEKYKQLKKNYIKKNSDYDRLKAELRFLQTKWENFKEEQPKADARLITAQNSRIKDLMARVTELEKRPEHPQFVTVDENNLSWALSFVNNARNEAAKFYQELERYSLNQYATEQALRSKTSEVLRLNEEVVKLKAENIKLNLINETEKQIESVSTIFDDQEKDANKENISTSTGRKVHFNEN